MQLQVQSEYPVDKVTPWIPIAFSGPGNPPIISKHKPYDVSAFVSNDPEPYNEYQVTLAPDAGAEYDACKPIIITGGSQSVNMHGTGNFPPNFEIKSKLDIVDLLALDPLMVIRPLRSGPDRLMCSSTSPSPPSVPARSRLAW